MIAKRFFRFGAALLAFSSLMVGSTLADGKAASSVSWSVQIHPTGGGFVPYTTSAPYQTGELLKSGKLTFDPGALVDLSFIANDGFKLVAVYKNSEDWTPYLDKNSHYQFGPVEKPHTISVLFELINPVGDFPIEFPDTPAEGVASVYDVTGNYKGVWDDREYNFDAAMDESGKVDGVGTIAGYAITSSPDGLVHASGVVKTVNKKPYATVVAKGEGTCDGVPGSGKGSAQGVIDVVNVGGQDVVEGAQSYVGKLGDAPIKDKNLPVSVATSPDLTRKWGMVVSIVERQEKVGKKIVTRLYGSGVLTLPTGEILNFAERKVKYSAKAGYNMKFTKGVNSVTGAIDKKTSVDLKKMVLTGGTGAWTVSDGEIAYAFLGQKGKGKLVDFGGDL